MTLGLIFMAPPFARWRTRRACGRGTAGYDRETSWGLSAAAGDEAADVDRSAPLAAGLKHVPDHGFADGIAGVVDNGLGRNGHPLLRRGGIRDPVAVGADAVVSAVPVGDVA